MSHEPERKCSNCGQPMTAWVNVDIDKEWMHPEKRVTMEQPKSVSDQHWCFACIRGKNDPTWLKPK